MVITTEAMTRFAHPSASRAPRGAQKSRLARAVRAPCAAVRWLPMVRRGPRESPEHCGTFDGRSRSRIPFKTLSLSKTAPSRPAARKPPTPKTDTAMRSSVENWPRGVPPGAPRPAGRAGHQKNQQGKPSEPKRVYQGYRVKQMS